MSSVDATKREAWAAKLASDSLDDQVEALRQISGQQSVSGLTAMIVQLAASRDEEVRMWSAEAMESAVRPDASEVLGLSRLLDHQRDGEVGYWAATMLGRLGTQAAAAAVALEQCLRASRYLPARERAAWAISQIGPAAAIAIPTLRETAAAAPPRLQRLATAALELIHQHAANHAPMGEAGETAA